MEGDKMIEIPTDDEFKRASKLMEERHRHMEDIRRLLKKHFSKRCPLYDFYVLPQRDVNFRAYVFFEKEEDIERCKKEGIFEQIEEFVLDKLERYGKGKREDISVAFEWDSDENVEAKFGGDYFSRLR
jgi:hypothetical protein